MKKKELEKLIEEAVKNDDSELLKYIDNKLEEHIMSMQRKHDYIKLRVANYGQKIGNKYYEDFPHIPSGHRNIMVWIPKKSKYMYYRENMDSQRHRMAKNKFEELGYECN